MINYSNNLTILISNHDNMLLFTFDGDCGYCVNKLKEYDSIYQSNMKDYGNIKCLAILNTKNKHILEYHLEKVNISIPVFIDTSSVFLSQNNITNNNIGFILDSCNTLIFKGDYLMSTRKFSKIIKPMDKK